MSTEAISSAIEALESIQWLEQDAQWVMRITADRRIEVNEGVDVTEAAQKVLEAMQHLLTPQQRKPLTDAQMMKLLDHYAENPSEYRYNDPLICFARAIEAAHGIKE